MPDSLLLLVNGFPVNTSLLLPTKLSWNGHCWLYCMSICTFFGVAIAVLMRNGSLKSCVLLMGFRNGMFFAKIVLKSSMTAVRVQIFGVQLKSTPEEGSCS